MSASTELSSSFDHLQHIFVKGEPKKSFTTQQQAASLLHHPSTSSSSKTQQHEFVEWIAPRNHLQIPGKGASGLQMLPLEAIWKWLWQNFTPSDTKTATISRDGLVEEVLSLPESSKTPKNSKQIQTLISTFIYRYLTTLFPNQNPSIGYCDEKRQLFYLRRATAAEKAERTKAVPTFPEELRQRLAKELREEMLGRRSATNLLSLGTGTSTGSLDNPATAPAALRAAMSGDARLPEILQRSRSAAAAASLAVPGEQPAVAVPSGNTSKNVLKRSGTETDFLTNGNTTGKRSRRKKEDGTEESAGEELVDADGSAADNSAMNEGPTEVLSPISPQNSLGTGTALNLGAGGVHSEVGLLRARQLAMQREIHDLRAELQRRDRTMHRELAALRMELDALRSELSGRAKTAAQPAQPVLTTPLAATPAPAPPSSPAPVKVPIAERPAAKAAAAATPSSTPTAASAIAALTAASLNAELKST